MCEVCEVSVCVVRANVVRACNNATYRTKRRNNCIPPLLHAIRDKLLETEHSVARELSTLHERIELRRKHALQVVHTIRENRANSGRCVGSYSRACNETRHST